MLRPLPRKQRKHSNNRVSTEPGAVHHVALPTLESLYIEQVVGAGHVVLRVFPEALPKRPRSVTDNADQEALVPGHRHEVDASLPAGFHVEDRLGRVIELREWPEPLNVPNRAIGSHRAS